MTPTQDNREAYRHVPWGGSAPGVDENWYFLGENLAGAIYRLQIRPSQGDTATPLVDLTNAIAGVDGLSWVWDAGFVDPETGATTGATIVTPYVGRTTLEAIQANADPSKPRVLYYDLWVTRSGGQTVLEVAGSFTLYPGVNI